MCPRIFVLLLCVAAPLITMKLHAENVPLFEYYETKKTSVKAIDGKYHEAEAESITLTANLLLPIYRGETLGLIANGGYVGLARTEFTANNRETLKSLNVLKMGLISYLKHSQELTSIGIVNYFNHPTSANAIRPMFDAYVGAVWQKSYTLLLRLIHHPHKNSYTPLVGWSSELSDRWAFDMLLPAHVKFIYRPASKSLTFTAGVQADSRDFPGEVDQQKGWWTGYHVRLLAQLSFGLYRYIHLSLNGGAIYTSNEFYAYEDDTSRRGFRETPSPFMGFGLEANF